MYVPEGVECFTERGSYLVSIKLFQAVDNSRFVHVTLGSTCITCFLSYNHCLLWINLIMKASEGQAPLLAFVIYLSILLLCLLGSTAFKVFHPVLFENCVNILKQWNMSGKNKFSSGSKLWIKYLLVDGNPRNPWTLILHK